MRRRRAADDPLSRDQGFGAPFGESAGHTLALGESGHHPIACLFAVGIESLDAVHLPVTQEDRHEDLLMVDRQVVDAGLGDRCGVTGKPGDAEAGRSIADIIVFGLAAIAAVARSR